MLFIQSIKRGNKMSKFLKLIYFTSFMALFLTINSVSADDKIKFNSDTQLQEVIKVGSEWECKWKNAPPAQGSGTKVYTFENVSLDKITAKIVNSYCPNSASVFEARYKKGKIIGVLTQSEPCSKITKGYYKVYKKKDGNHYMKGPYSFKWTDGNTYKGNTTCHPK